MILRSAIATLTGMLLSGAAWAAPVLKADIMVTGAIVTVGDMFDDAGAAAEEALFRAPLPGTSGLVGLADIDAASQYEAITEHLMFDARAPEGSALPGGVGATFDWTMLSGRRFARPWFLAGGLDPWNVTEAIAASGAPMVDVSSGVERGAGLKDPGLISAFLDAVRRA